MSDRPFISNSDLFRQGVKACVPTMPGYWAVSFACSAIGTISGFSFWQIAAMSIFLYAGSAQFLFYSLALAGAGIFEIILAVAFINMRYLLINTYMAKFFHRSTRLEKIIGGALITDETFGIAAQYAKQHNDELPYMWLLGLNLAAWFNWISVSIFGILLASFLPLWMRDSLSFSLVGMFVGLMVYGLHASQTRFIDIIVILSAILCDLYFYNLINKSFALILAAMLAAALGVCISSLKLKKIR